MTEYLLDFSFEIGRGSVLSPRVSTPTTGVTNISRQRQTRQTLYCISSFELRQDSTAMCSSVQHLRWLMKIT